MNSKWLLPLVLAIVMLTACGGSPDSSSGSATQYGGEDPIGTATVLEANQKADATKQAVIQRAEAQRLQREANARTTATAQVRDGEMKATAVAIDAQSTRMANEASATAQANNARATEQALETQHQTQEIATKQTAVAFETAQHQLALAQQATATAQRLEDERHQQQLESERTQQTYETIWLGLRSILLAIAIGIVAIAIILPARKAVVKMWAEWQTAQTQQARIAAGAKYNTDILPPSALQAPLQQSIIPMQVTPTPTMTIQLLQPIGESDIVAEWGPPADWPTIESLLSGSADAPEDIHL